VPSQLECSKGCLLQAARDWVARTQSLRTVLAGSEMQGVTPRLGWVHPLLRRSTAARHSVGVIRQIPRIRPTTAPPQPRGATSPTSSNPPQRRVPPLENPLWRAPMEALTLSGRLRKLATLNFAVHPRRSLPSALDVFRPPSLRPLAEHHPTSHRGCAHRPLEPAEHVEALEWVLVREASPYFAQSSPLLAARVASWRF